MQANNQINGSEDSKGSSREKKIVALSISAWMGGMKKTE